MKQNLKHSLHPVFLSLAAALLLCACENYDWVGMLFKGQSPTVNSRFEANTKYNEEHPIGDFSVSSDSYSIYVVADIHLKDSLAVMDRFVKHCIADSTAEKFSLCLGDMINAKDHQGIAAQALKELDSDGRRMLCTVGNHDLYFGDWENYRLYWSCCYSFKVHTPSAGDDLFINVDSAEGTIGTSQRKWLEDVLAGAQGKYRSIVVFTHTNFFNTDGSQGTSGNFTFEETADLLSLFSKYGVKYVLTGHDHYYEKVVFRGVEYYTINSLTTEDTRHYFYRFTFGDRLSFEEIKI